MPKIIHIRELTVGHDVDIEEYRHIIDSRDFQRLRNINQLDFNYMAIYPGVRHTRFWHSVGVLECERRIIDMVNSRTNGYKFSESESATAKLAALLHDFKHSPGSHGVETVLEGVGEPDHDTKTVEVLHTLEEKIKKVPSIDFDLLIKIFKREHPLYHTIWDLVGSDVLHYLNDDAIMAGLNPLTDADSIIAHIAYDGEKYGVMFKKREVVRKHIEAYVRQYLTFYNAKACALMKGLLRRGVYEAIEAGLKPSEIWEMNDFELAIAMHNYSPLSREILERILYRRLPKAFLTIKIQGYEAFEDPGNKFNKVFTLPEKKLANITKQLKNAEKVIELERSIEKTLDYNPGSITVADMPEIRLLKEKDVNLQKKSGEWVTLFTMHPQYAQYRKEFLNGIRREYTFRIGVHEHLREDAYKHADEVFGLLTPLI